MRFLFFGQILLTLFYRACQPSVVYIHMALFDAVPVL